jgi:hypothetical protein
VERASRSRGARSSHPRARGRAGGAVSFLEDAVLSCQVFWLLVVGEQADRSARPGSGGGHVSSGSSVGLPKGSEDPTSRDPNTPFIAHSPMRTPAPGSPAVLSFAAIQAVSILHRILERPRSGPSGPTCEQRGRHYPPFVQRTALLLLRAAEIRRTAFARIYCPPLPPARSSSLSPARSRPALPLLLRPVA